jgi:hypothetical protein
MAETLGSLIDKLTIKDLREFHLKEMLDSKERKFSVREIKSKIALLHKQKKTLTHEIGVFVALASQGKIQVRDDKLKIYNAINDMNRIPQYARIGEAISGLAQKNLELWHLEDQARRKDVTLAYIGQIKKKIDITNQQRNDHIDKIDLMLEESLKDKFKRKS